MAMRGIYSKDKELDKTNYQASELDQLDNYIKNYMQDDPKNLSEEDKQKLVEQFHQLQKQLKQNSTTTKQFNIKPTEPVASFPPVKAKKISTLLKR